MDPGNVGDLDDVEQVVRPEDELGDPVDGQPHRALQVGGHDPPVVALPANAVDGALRLVDPEDEVLRGEGCHRRRMAHVVEGREELLSLPTAAAGEQPHAGDARGRGEEEGVGRGGDAGSPVEQHEADGARAGPLGVAPGECSTVPFMILICFSAF